MQTTTSESPMTNGFVAIESVRTSNAKKTLLESMDIDFPEGTVTAIMGPSGSGKTTCMDFISDNIASNLEARGEVYLPGTFAFVPQEDSLHGFYTPTSYLRHYSRLAGTTVDQDEIDSLLANLGLRDQKDTIVGDIFLKGLSGGQKRRLSVALEALTKPQNFFLDEPTSGLDAESALQVMKFLTQYVRAAKGRRVILTIHQPSSFIWQLIDNVVLLSKGKLIYQGPRNRMENFFSFVGYPTPADYNPADHYVTAVNDEFSYHELSVKEWSNKYLEFKKQQHTAPFSRGERSESIIEAQQKAEVLTVRGSSISVVFELTRRYFLNLWFNPGILGTRVAMYGMLALMVGALFWDVGNDDSYQAVQSRIALLFYCAAFFVFMSVAVLPFTVIERAIVDKEVRNSYYHPSLYQIAQGIASVPGCALLAFLTTLIVISMTGMREPMWYFLAMFLSLLCAEALAQLVSHVVPHFIIGMALVAGMYGFFMLVQGFMLVPSDFPAWLRWTHNVAFHTYAWRSFMYSEFGDESVVFDSVQLPTGFSVLETYEIEDVNRSNDMIVLLGYALILHLCSIVTLHFWYSAFKGRVVPPQRRK